MTHEVAVVIPSVDRPDDLRKCLVSLERQRTNRRILPIVVTLQGDGASSAVMQEFDGVANVMIDERDLIVSLRAGLEYAKRSSVKFVAFTDDDAEPSENWLETACSFLASHSDVAAIGGPDVQPGVNLEPVSRVGSVNSWTGRLIGNHHHGTEFDGEVDVVKGVNMIWRTDAIRLPHRDAGEYVGSGAIPHGELFMASSAIADGYKLWFSRNVAVIHHASPRSSARFSDSAAECYNRILALAPRSNMFKTACQCAYSILIGFRNEPGVVRAAFAVAAGDRTALRRVPIVTRAALSAMRTVYRRPTSSAR